MIQKLLEDVRGPQLSDSISKVVKLKCYGDFFNEDSSYDVPLFNKKYFEFDKYELSKIMSFEDFELLFRPFKSNNSYKKYVLLKKIQRKLPLVIICFLILQFLFLYKNVSPTIILAFVCGAFVLMGATLAFFAYLSYCKSRNLKDFEEYTAYLRENELNIILTVSQSETSFFKYHWKQMQQPGPFLLKSKFTQFQIKSHRVREDFDYVKLYCKSPGGILCPTSQATPVIQQSQFQFSKEKLNAFLPFEEIERLMQPFASNQLYQRRIFLFKVYIVLILTIILLIVPSLVLIKDKLWQIIVSILELGILLAMFLRQQIKLQRLRSDIVSEFRQHCRKVSAAHEKVEILAQFSEGSGKSCLEGENKLYCLLVRLKETVDR